MNWVGRGESLFGGQAAQIGGCDLARTASGLASL
jgi:hypothetical protein